MQRSVIIVGGGLAGLTAARLLHKSGIDFQLIEARERLGGRIFSVDTSGQVAKDGFDLGPSWFWPNMQPGLATLVHELGLDVFPQHSEGDVVFDRMSSEAPQRYRGLRQEPQSMRIAGGTAALVGALEGALPAERLRRGVRVLRVVLGDKHSILTVRATDESEYVLHASHVIFALPPRLLEATVLFSPAVDPATAQHWRRTGTWMAPHAKFFALYDRPFWREAGLSGTAQSMIGPLAEIHDATSSLGSAGLFGFLGVDADERFVVGEKALVEACVKQLARLFGADAAQPRATLFKDWSTDVLTATQEDRIAVGHPSPSTRPWVSGVWRERISLAGSETSGTDPGYLAGAVDAAYRTVSEITRASRLVVKERY